MEIKKVTDKESQKNWRKSIWQHFLALIVLTILLIAIWLYVPMHKEARWITTIMILIFFYKPILAAIEVVKGVIGWTNTEVLKEDRPERYIE